MRLPVFVLLLAVSASFARCFADGLPVTVLVSFEHSHPAASLNAMEHQLDSMLAGTGLKLVLRDRSAVPPRAEFGELLVFKMKGHCSMDALPVAALSDERGPLAMAYSSDGTVLPFGEVECDTVRHSLQRLVGKYNPRAYQSAFDAALGMVMAHEIYHMLAQTPEHTHRGVTKASLSAQELFEGKLSLPAIARIAIRQAPVAAQ